MGEIHNKLMHEFWTVNIITMFLCVKKFSNQLYLTNQVTLKGIKVVS